MKTHEHIKYFHVVIMINLKGDSDL